MASCTMRWLTHSLTWHIGEDWNGIMHDAMATPETTGCDLDAGDCGSPLALPFFLSFVLGSTYLILNMMIAGKC